MHFEQVFILDTHLVIKLALKLAVRLMDVSIYLVVKLNTVLYQLYFYQIPQIVYFGLHLPAFTLYIVLIVSQIIVMIIIIHIIKNTVMLGFIRF